MATATDNLTDGNLTDGYAVPVYRWPEGSYWCPTHEVDFYRWLAGTPAPCCGGPSQAELNERGREPGYLERLAGERDANHKAPLDYGNGVWRCLGCGRNFGKVKPGQAVSLQHGRGRCWALEDLLPDDEEPEAPEPLAGRQAGLEEG